MDWDKSVRSLNNYVSSAASLSHWLFREYTGAGSALKTLDFPEQVLHAAHQLGMLQKGIDDFEISHILSAVTLLLFQQETNQT